MSPRLTTLVASAFAALLLVAGGLLIFLPDEAAALWGAGEGSGLPFALLGAALFGLGEVNWLARRTVLGGIYGRPLVMGNLVHFLVGALTLLRHGGAPGVLWAVTAVYVLGAVFYGLLLFTPPKSAAA